ncbi:Phage-related protein, tail component (COG4723) [uncultured Mediterranean phage uvMED]|nr:Phage-related protein, tail component (COG4723) [uncultured Mediterranean phage uvMED]
MNGCLNALERGCVMLRKIKLYGKLAKFIGHDEFEVKVDSVAQAVSFLIHNFPEVETYMSPQYYTVKVGNSEIDKDELFYPISNYDISFIPAIMGKGNVGKILLGGALIAMSFGVGGLFAAPMSFGAGGFAAAGLGAKAAFGIGAALVLGGVSGMLFPVPDQQGFSSEEDPRLSFSFSGVQNTSRAGTPVPIVYGEIFTGSVVISAAIDTNQVEV